MNSQSQRASDRARSHNFPRAMITLSLSLVSALFLLLCRYIKKRIFTVCVVVVAAACSNFHTYIDKTRRPHARLRDKNLKYISIVCERTDLGGAATAIAIVFSPARAFFARSSNTTDVLVSVSGIMT